MKQEFSLFRQISDTGLSANLCNFLDTHDFTYLEERDNDTVYLMIATSQSEQLERLLIEHNELFLQNAPDDLYLQGFTDKELLEIITDPQDWGAIDFHLAVNILVERGIEIRQTEIVR
ncbi:MAG: hypothetical protein WBA74_14325 [Cyclobacteriaceae bacterium]